MPRIIVTKEACDVIWAHAQGEMKETGVVLPSGDYEFPVGDDVLEGIKRNAFPNESISDTLVRMFAMLDGKANN